MRQVLGIVAAVAALGAVAVAQTPSATPAPETAAAAPAVAVPPGAIMTSACPELPPEPTQPELTGMRRSQVTELNDKTMEPWRVRAGEILECRNKEVRANDALLQQMKAQYDTVLAASKTMLETNRSYKARADAFVMGWNDKVAAYQNKGATNRNQGQTGRSAQ